MAFDVPTKDQLIFVLRHPIRWYREGGPADPDAADIRRKQIRLVFYAMSAVALVAVGIGAYQYLASLDERSEQAYLEGERLLRPNAYGDAIKKFDRAISLNSKNEKAHLARGEALATLGNRDEAMREFSKVIELKPNWPRGYSARGKLYRDMGDHQKALADLNTSIDIEENSENLIERGQLYDSLGETKKAIDDYTRYIKVRDGVPYLYILRARARQKIGDLQGAKEDRRMALVYEGKLSPLFPGGAVIPVSPDAK